MEIEEIKVRANKIIGDNKITTLINEAELMEKLNEISQSVDQNNCIAYTKTLDAIEDYLIQKEKLETKKNDIKFLSNLAKELREQQVRITDNSNPPLFIVSNEFGENIYFLTRKALENYSEYNLKDTRKIIEVPSNRSNELTELLEIVKRNF